MEFFLHLIRVRYIYSGTRSNTNRLITLIDTFAIQFRKSAHSTYLKKKHKTDWQPRISNDFNYVEIEQNKKQVLKIEKCVSI